MARPGGQIPAVLVGLSFASAVVLAYVLLKRLRSSRGSRGEQTLSYNCTANPSECAVAEESSISLCERAKRFEEARGAVEVAAGNLGSTSLLQLYGLFKQATQGDCDQKEPSVFSVQSHAKWAAWHGHKGLCSDVAKAKYVDLALHLGLIPPREVKGSAAKAGGARLGPVFSRPTLSGDGGYNTSSKGDSFCCMVAEGKFNAVREALMEDPSLVHATGEGGMTGLHFAADRGHADIARMLLECGAKVNLQDECGETPLHVALAAEQEELISILIEAGADTSLKNSEGNSCADLLKEEEHRLKDRGQEDSAK